MKGEEVSMTYVSKQKKNRTKTTKYNNDEQNKTTKADAKYKNIEKTNR